MGRKGTAELWERRANGSVFDLVVHHDFKKMVLRGTEHSEHCILFKFRFLFRSYSGLCTKPIHVPCGRLPSVCLPSIGYVFYAHSYHGLHSIDFIVGFQD